MLDNTDRVERYLAGMSREMFETNEALRDAVERCIERVCEGAFRLGDRAQELMPHQPWADIRGMGNRLRHAYDRIDGAIIYNTATIRLPELAAEIRRILSTLAD